MDGFSSAISGCFGCLPLTSFSQNVGLVTMTKVINRFTILLGALVLILASLFPPLGAFFNSLPQAVLGGCTVMMFGSIMYEGIKMLTVSYTHLDVYKRQIVHIGYGMAIRRYFTARVRNGNPRAFYRICAGKTSFFARETVDKRKKFPYHQIQDSKEEE